MVEETGSFPEIFPVNATEGMLEMANGYMLKSLRKMGEKKKKETGKKKQKVPVGKGTGERLGTKAFRRFFRSAAGLIHPLLKYRFCLRKR